MGHFALSTCDLHRSIGFPQWAHVMDTTPSRRRFSAAALTAAAVRLDSAPVDVDSATAIF